MVKRLQGLLIPLALLLALAMAVFIDYQKASVPMVRSAPRHPVYVLGAPHDQANVAQGEIILVLGPWCYGLFTGTQAFSSVAEASDFIRLQGLNSDKWQLYQTSGDYLLDVTDGALNKTLQLVAPLPFSH